jgi:hypothetical protein
MSNNKIVTAFASTALAFAATPLFAQDYGIAINAGVGYSDNVTRSVFEKESASAGIVGVEVSARKDTGRLQYEGYGDVSYIRYFGTEVADDDVVGNMDLRGSYEFVPDRFGWSVTDSYTQLRENFLIPASPTNRQGFNQFITGPNLRLPFGGDYEFRGDARYSRSDYEQSSEFDAQRYSANLELRRMLGQRSSLGVRASRERFSYGQLEDTAFDTEFDRSEYALRFETVRARTDMSLEAGVTAVEGDTLDESGPLARLEIRRRISPALTLAFDGARDFATTGERPRQFRPDDVSQPDDDTNIPSAEPFTQTRAALNLIYNQTRTEWLIGAAYVREQYEEPTSLDRKLFEYRAAITRTLSPRLQIGASGAIGKDKLEILDYDVLDSNYGINLRWRATNGLSLVLIGEYFDRDGSLAGAFDYHELAGRLLLRYVPGASSSTAPAAAE